MGKVYQILTSIISLCAVLAVGMMFIPGINAQVVDYAAENSNKVAEQNQTIDDLTTQLEELNQQKSQLQADYDAGLIENERQLAKFNEDKTFSANVKGKSFNGTYSVSEDYKTMTLQFGKALAVKPFTASISATSSQLNLLFQADRLLELLGKLTSSSSNTTLKTVGTIVNQYDGMKLGLELKK